MTDFQILTNYSDRSDVFVGRLPDDLRETLKEAKVMTYHPRLYPRDTSYPQGEKGWVIRKEDLPTFEKILTDAGVTFTKGSSTRKTLGLPKRVYKSKKNKEVKAPVPPSPLTVEDDMFFQIEEAPSSPSPLEPVKEET